MMKSFLSAILALLLASPAAAQTASVSNSGANSTVLMAPVTQSSPPDGTVWYDSAAKALVTQFNGLAQYHSTVIFVATADKTVTNTSAATSIIGTGVGSITLPANFLVAGKTLRISIGGVFSTLLTPGNLTIVVKLGSTTIASSTISNILASASNNAFQGAGTITCRSAGASGSVSMNGNVNYDTGVLTRGFAALNNSGSTVTLDTTASQTLDITVQWATASASNSIKATTATVEILD